MPDGKDGGRDRDRTCDPSRVKGVRYRCATRPWGDYQALLGPCQAEFTAAHDWRSSMQRAQRCSNVRQTTCCRRDAQSSTAWPNYRSTAEQTGRLQTEAGHGRVILLIVTACALSTPSARRCFFVARQHSQASTKRKFYKVADQACRTKGPRATPERASEAMTKAYRTIFTRPHVLCRRVSPARLRQAIDERVGVELIAARSSACAIFEGEKRLTPGCRSPRGSGMASQVYVVALRKALGS